jgi:enolase
MGKIKEIEAREILASGGAPTVEATVILESGVAGEASVSYGASAGSKEAVVLLDADSRRFKGKGMLRAVSHIKEKIAPAIIGMEGLKNIDQKMLELDGTHNKENLGANAILAVSMAYARAQAIENRQMLYEYLQDEFELPKSTKLPKPMVVMIEGGKHADNSTDLQEYLVSALGNKGAAENVRMTMEIYEALKKILKSEGKSTNVGNEGAFAPNGIENNEKAMEYLVRAIEEADYQPGVEAGISLDAAASEFYNKETQKYHLKLENREFSPEELIEYFAQWIGKYPFVSWEDMLSEYDWENWPKLVEKVEGQIKIVADDLTVTNTKLWQEAMEKKAATAILIKLNQAGTVSETIECCKLAVQEGLWTIPSHRGGGESNDTFLVDLAVAVGSEYIKVGPTRGERVAKYNRLMRIEEMLGKN